MDDRMDRRYFLGYAAATVSAASLPLGRAASQPTGQVLTRRNVNGPDAKADLDAYAAAVAAMRALPRTDARSWERQSEIHKTRCPHSNWWFLPWHRAYLLYFEQICRDLSNKKDFALPYWDWSTDNKIPGPFLNANSPLFQPKRVHNEVEVERTSRKGVIEPLVLEKPDFVVMGSGPASQLKGEGTSGALERPHNHVHRQIGGVMADPDTAALDPVFWVHHAFIDRVWAEWQVRHPTRTPPDSLWRNQRLDFFGANRKPVRISPADILDTRKLGYAYEDLREQHFAVGPQAGSFALAAALRHQAEVHLEETADRTLDPAAGPRVVTSSIADVPDPLRKRLNRVAVRNLASYLFG